MTTKLERMDWENTKIEVKRSIRQGLVMVETGEAVLRRVEEELAKYPKEEKKDAHVRNSKGSARPARKMEK